MIIWDADNNACRERYCIHPSKSYTLWFNHRKKKDTELDNFMGGEKVDTPDSTVHLGIVRNTSRKADIEGKIILERKTAYSLMGAGLHVGNGLRAYQGGLIWSTFVIPRFLYELEVQPLTNKDIETSEKFQRKCLKQIQGLKHCLFSSPWYFTCRIHTVLHKNLLNMFVNMIRIKDSIEYKNSPEAINDERISKREYFHSYSIDFSTLWATLYI